MQDSFSSARQVSEHLLKRTERAFLTDDVGEFKECLVLPYSIETFDGRRVLETPSELQELFYAIRTHHRKTGVTAIVRHVVEAAFKDPETIEATFETRLLNGTVLTQKPYPVFSVLKCIEGEWRARSMTFAIDDSPDHNAALMHNET